MSQEVRKTEVRKTITGIGNIARKLKPRLSAARYKALHNDLFKHD